MADTVIEIVEQRVVVQAFGADMLEPYIAAAAAFAASAGEDAGQTAADRIATGADRGEVEDLVGLLMAALASGTATPFDTRADSTANFAGIPANGFYQILRDEAHDGDWTANRKVSNAPVFIRKLAGSASSFNVLDNGTNGQTLLVQQMPQSAMNSFGGYDNVDLKLVTTKNVFTSSDGKTLTDYAFGLGWNLTGSYAPDKAGLPAVSYRIESLFRYNRFGHNVTHCEIHVGALIPQDDHSIEFRPLSIGAPHNKTDWAESSSMILTSAYISILDGAQPPNEFISIDARASNGGTRYFTTTSLVFRDNTNNLATFRQLNLAGTAYLNNWFLSSANHLKAEVALDITANASIGVSGNVAIIGLSGAMASGASAIAHTDFTTSGDVVWFDVRGSVSGYLETSIANQSGSGKVGQSITTGGGKAYRGIRDVNNSRYVGEVYDPSDGTYTIGGQDRGTAAGGGAAIKIKYSNAQVLTFYPLGLASYTAGTKPNAATAGVSIIQISDYHPLAVVQGGAWIYMARADAIYPEYVASRYYCPPIMAHPVASTSAPGAAGIRAVAFTVPHPVLCVGLACRLPNSVSGKSIQLAIGQGDASTKLGTGAPIAKTSNITPGAGAQNAEGNFASSIWLYPGITYWAAIMTEDAAITVNATAAAIPRTAVLVGASTLASAVGSGGIVYQGTASPYGTWPNFNTLTESSQAEPVIYLKT